MWKFAQLKKPNYPFEMQHIAMVTVKLCPIFPQRICHSIKAFMKSIIKSCVKSLYPPIPNKKNSFRVLIMVKLSFAKFADNEFFNSVGEIIRRCGYDIKDDLVTTTFEYVLFMLILARVHPTIFYSQKHVCSIVSIYGFGLGAISYYLVRFTNQNKMPVPSFIENFYKVIYIMLHVFKWLLAVVMIDIRNIRCKLRYFVTQYFDHIAPNLITNTYYHY